MKVNLLLYHGIRKITSFNYAYISIYQCLNNIFSASKVQIKTQFSNASFENWVLICKVFENWIISNFQKNKKNIIYLITYERWNDEIYSNDRWKCLPPNDVCWTILCSTVIVFELFKQESRKIVRQLGVYPKSSYGVNTPY